MKPVAFVGFASGWRNAPFGDNSFEWWACNQHAISSKDKHIEVMFDMHDWVASDYYPTYYKELQKKHSYTVVRPYYDETVPNCEKFPLKEANKLFHDHAYGSTMSYIIVYATLKKKKDLFIWGMNTSEFIQYPEMGVSFGYCRGVAQEHGLRVHIISPDVPKAAHVYGYRKYSWKDSYYDMVAVYGNENYVIKDGSGEELRRK